ncbi:MAG TPA: hypothetical protein VFB54_20675 [Burkholderiales bacterium]|nr:hypothetical protein [Burkholderiales bacterium]
MKTNFAKALLALALVGAAGAASAHDRGWDRGDRGWDRGDRGWHHGWRDQHRDPWCHEHRAFHRHDGWHKHGWDRDWRYDGYGRSDYRRWNRWDDDSLTIIFRSGLN